MHKDMYCIVTVTVKKKKSIIKQMNDKVIYVISDTIGLFKHS